MQIQCPFTRNTNTTEEGLLYREKELYFSEFDFPFNSWGIDALGTIIAEVELENGTIGFGVSVGGHPAAYIIEQHLSRFLEGQDVRNVELMWDQMFRGTMPYGQRIVSKYDSCN